MGEPVKFLRETTSAFSHWAHRVQGEELPEELYGERGSTRPISFKAFTESCVGLLIFTDRQHTAKECCKQLVSDGVYKTLGEGTAGDWEAISEGLAQRAGTQALDPAWLEQSLQESMDSVQQRLRRVCCTGEAAVLMLRLAVRPACLASSWYGPWESGEALQQLTMVNAWSSLVRALKALLVTSGENLAKQYNAINIVSDILHVSRAPSAPASCSASLHSFKLTLCQTISCCAVHCKTPLYACADLLQPERAEHAPEASCARAGTRGH